jgi:hypothetical protein
MGTWRRASAGSRKESGTMKDRGALARIVLGAALAAALAAPQGCTTWQGGVRGYARNRLKDALEMFDLGVVRTETRRYAFYLAPASLIPIGYGNLDGTFVGMGGGDIGKMRVHYRHYGYGIVGREVTGWGNAHWDFPEFDPEKPETMNCASVGIVGLFLPPYDSRPAGRPT